MSETDKTIGKQYDFSKPQKNGGLTRQVICEKCGTLNEYYWLPGYSCPEVKKSGFTKSKIVPGLRPPRAINCRCKFCGRKMKSEIEDDSPGTKIIDNGTTHIDDENKEVMKNIRVKIKGFNEQKIINKEIEFCEEHKKILKEMK